MDEKAEIEKDFVQLSRMAMNEQWEDVRLFVARVLRRRRNESPRLSQELRDLLKSNDNRGRKSPLRDRVDFNSSLQEEAPPPALSQFPAPDFSGPEQPDPLFSAITASLIEQLIIERQKADKLRAIGLNPSRSALFAGPPGVGKTLAAQWIAFRLDKPLLVLDLASVMSSYLGRTGNNVRAALDYAKSNDCVLLLDEIDAIAKRRSDESDVGELKRLVTVVLQQIDNWPDTGLLLAATNHPDLVDPALWRRFDAIVQFELPDPEHIKKAIVRFLGGDAHTFRDWIGPIALVSKGESFGSLEKTINRFRRQNALQLGAPDELVLQYLRERVGHVGSKDRIKLAAELYETSTLSQHRVSEITGVARDTIRKHSKTN